MIDLLDPNIRCEPWPDYPREVYGAIGALINNTYLITCGGVDTQESIRDCYMLDQSTITPIHNLTVDSFYSASAAVLNQSLFVSGGATLTSNTDID